VTNTSISRLRRRRSTVSFEEISGIHSHGGVFEQYSRYEVPKPDDVLERQEQDEQLQSAISALPPTYRRVISLGVSLKNKVAP